MRRQREKQNVGLQARCRLHGVMLHSQSIRDVVGARTKPLKGVRTVQSVNTKALLVHVGHCRSRTFSSVRCFLQPSLITSLRFCFPAWGDDGRGGDANDDADEEEGDDAGGDDPWSYHWPGLGLSASLRHLLLPHTLRRASFSIVTNLISSFYQLRKRTPREVN